MKNLLYLIFLMIFTTILAVYIINFNEKGTDITLNNQIKTDEIQNENLEESNFTYEYDEYLNGVFVTTVYNLDFPSSSNLSEQQLKNEIDEILDNIKEQKITDVFFQVRPCADAFYYSEIYPTSIYLTGNQDTVPEFDVLEYYTTGCHKRGLKIHAWINPYRITKSSDDVLSDTHIAVTNPELTVLHTDGNLYFDPALDEVTQLILDGVEEIITNYDIDGIHFDDYFYPSTTFDDAQSYEKYGDGRSLDDFRRDNITNFVQTTYNFIKITNPNVVFGISPSGIWANASDGGVEGGSNTSGTGSYFYSYADTKKWVEMEILDYIAPQIYWNIGFQSAEYEVLVDWWAEVCAGTNVELYICHANYKEADGTFETGEIDRQIEYNKTKSNVSGSIFFRYSHII
ncbi:MAG: family 10 glycosylhydrolase [Clostridia bacterium]